MLGYRTTFPYAETFLIVFQITLFLSMSLMVLILYLHCKIGTIETEEDIRLLELSKRGIKNTMISIEVNLILSSLLYILL